MMCILIHDYPFLLYYHIKQKSSEYVDLATWRSQQMRPMAFRPCFTTSLAQQIIFLLPDDSILKELLDFSPDD
jgi:hypothetical protein